MEHNQTEKTGKHRKRRRGGKVLLVTAGVLAAAAVAIFLWQKNNIEALKQFSQYSQAELEQQLQDNDQQVQDILNAALEAAKQVSGESTSPPVQPETPVTPTEPSGGAGETPSQPVQPEAPAAPAVPAEPVEEQTPPEPEVVTPAEPQTPQVPETTVTPEPVTPQEPAPVTPVEPVQPEATTPATPPAAETPPAAQTPPTQTSPTYEEELNVIVDKVYALRTEYLQTLEDLLAEAKADYKAIPEENRTKKAIINFVSTYITKANNLERECDGKMDALVTELTALQKKYGQSLELVDTVKYTYANEKSLKKAWYMSELERRGLIS